MKIKFNIDENLSEEKAEFWLRKMTDKISQIANELTDKKEFIWCFRRGDAYPVKFNEIYLIQVENEKTYVYTEQETYLYKGRLYQVQKVLPSDFVTASRSAVLNYHQLDHLQILSDGNIDAVLKNKMHVQISRRKIKELKERLGL
ncbi:LytTR family DNA-binding domain-containing protein [uncultured Lactobacillus sp.]|uniref:LytTR family DNA-binding domain-containing protein n=1 Tax=uncultured Lactobacillus sp. TaxID=153152 RepID=UPI00259B8342|nr:LytTR family DNA-binding domain-containing protein [uncultured Lactobacillus sp.]